MNTKERPEIFSRVENQGRPKTRKHTETFYERKTHIFLKLVSCGGVNRVASKRWPAAWWWRPWPWPWAHVDGVPRRSDIQPRRQLERSQLERWQLERRQPIHLYRWIWCSVLRLRFLPLRLLQPARLRIRLLRQPRLRLRQRQPRVRLLRQPILRLRQWQPSVRLLSQPRLPLRQRQPRLPLQQWQPRVSI